MSDLHSTDAHLLPPDDPAFGRRRVRYEQRVVIKVDAGDGPTDHITVAAEGQRPLVWIRAPRALILRPGDSVWALWYEGFVQGWGPVAKAVCVDGECERPLSRPTPADTGRRR